MQFTLEIHCPRTLYGEQGTSKIFLLSFSRYQLLSLGLIAQNNCNILLQLFK